MTKSTQTSKTGGKEKTSPPDLIIIGAGPGGYVAAIKGAQLGLNVTVVEKDKPGGVCANVGCIPSKALIHLADSVREARALSDLGIRLDMQDFTWESARKRAMQAAARSASGTAHLLKKNKVTLIQDTARLLGPGRLQLASGKTMEARGVIVSTGSRPRQLAAFPFDEKVVLSSTGALGLTELPARLLVIGGGAIGCEFAYVFNTFGVEVTIVEVLDRLLPLADPEVGALLERAFNKQGIKVFTKTRAEGFERKGDHLVVPLTGPQDKKRPLDCDAILVAIGRQPNVEEAGLAEAGVELEKGAVKVGDHYLTNLPGVYAIGDVIPTAQLAHLASKEGELAVLHFAGKSAPARVDPDLVPTAVYCEPQVASFGLTDKPAQAEGRKVAAARFPYRANGKAMACRKTEGFVKILYDQETKEILGASIIGAEATELVHELLLLKQAELLPEDAADMIHAHPTYSEVIMEVMRTVEGRAVHM